MRYTAEFRSQNGLRPAALTEVKQALYLALRRIVVYFTKLKYAVSVKLCMSHRVKASDSKLSNLYFLLSQSPF